MVSTKSQDPEKAAALGTPAVCHQEKCAKYYLLPSLREA